jgi:hypothetical protein
MKNKLLHITRRAIPYIRELRPIAGSVTATLLWQQLDYWFAQQPNGFYKFLESCQHAAYKEGDSWTEELAFTKEEFRTAFKKIGIVYKSKKDYDKAQNKFVNDVGKAFYFCSYHNKIKGLTWYFRNHQLVDNKIKEISLGNDRLNELKQMPYDEYLRTPEWKKRRKKQLKSAGHRCQVCNSPKRLNVHHRTYDRRGQELPQDLIVLCRNCHSIFHKTSKLYEV